MPTLQPSTILNHRYRLRERIGQGGFSVVWLAADTRRKEMPVVVKVFAPQNGLDQELIDQFKKEYELTSTLRDARLIKATEYFVHEDSPCLVFPYMSGGSLDKKLRKEGRLPEAEIAKIIYQIAGGLHYLHSQQPKPVLHLDIKPENILIDYGGDYVLSDFGLSRHLRSSLLRRSGIKGSTQTHQSPEIIKGERVDTKADIFALGVTLYECCEGLLDGNFLIGYKLTFGSGSLPEINQQHYTRRLAALVHACLDPDPALRPTAAELERQSRFYMENAYWNETAVRPTGAPQSPTSPDIDESPRRDMASETGHKKENRRSTLMAIAMISAVILAGAWAVWAVSTYRNIQDDKNQRSDEFKDMEPDSTLNKLPGINKGPTTIKSTKSESVLDSSAINAKSKQRYAVVCQTGSNLEGATEAARRLGGEVIERTNCSFTPCYSVALEIFETNKAAYDFIKNYKNKAKSTKEGKKASKSIAGSTLAVIPIYN